MIRDYSLLGLSAKEAEEKGLAAAKWYHSDISREDMKELMQRRDLPAIKDTLIYYLLLLSSALLGVLLWGTLYCCLLYTSPSPRDMRRSRMPSSA